MLVCERVNAAAWCTNVVPILDLHATASFPLVLQRGLREILYGQTNPVLRTLLLITIEIVHLNPIHIGLEPSA